MEVLNLVRESIKRNHTAAHLLQAALQVLGDHVHQAGQLVSAYPLQGLTSLILRRMTPEEIKTVEFIVNSKILPDFRWKPRRWGLKRQRLPAQWRCSGKNTAMVRELTRAAIPLTGAHVDNTSKIGLFKIVSESSVAAGVRRIEAKPECRFWSFLQETTAAVHQAAAELKPTNPAELVAKCGAVMSELRRKTSRSNSLTRSLLPCEFGSVAEDAKEIKGCRIVSAMMSDVSTEAPADYG